MNATFWFTAGVLTGVTATIVAIPFWHGIERPVAESTPSAAKAPSMEEATARLAARLEREGGSAGDWELLAKSYDFLGRTAEAGRARARASSGESLDVGVAMHLLQAGSAENAGGEAAISGTVSVDTRLANRVEPRATLFIYAKAADSPGPPLAVQRLTADHWPVSFRLDDSMAMLPSRRLSQFQKIIVEARISRTGQAAPAAGDLYVTSSVVTPSAGKKLALVIDHEIG
jgi:cytochrome c-type biogenesis protein CcmH